MRTGLSSGEPRRFHPRALLWTTVVLAVIWSVGTFWDSRYHVHSGFEIESFFTVNHAMSYGGVTGVVLVVAAYLAEGRRLGERRRRWLPAGFPLVLGGALVYLAAGGLDALWHEAFGFEADLEALLSPTHQALIVARMVALVGLLRAALEYRASAAPEGRLLRKVDLPAVVSIALLFGVVNWLLSYSQPFAVDYPAADPVAANLHGLEHLERGQFTARVAGTTGLFFHSMLLALFLVAALRRLRLPLGAITVVMLYNASVQALMTDMWRYVPAVLLAAVVGEAICARLRRGGRPNGTWGYWLLGAAVPFTQTGAYFAIIALGGGVAWSIHLWAGVPVVAALYGLVGAVLLAPPLFLDRRETEAPHRASTPGSRVGESGDRAETGRQASRERAGVPTTSGRI